MLLSIIIPIYNSERVLEETIDSIIKQSGDFEVILINDGSTDCSLEICKEKQRLDPRIKVINSINLGVSHARNIGIQEARGEYVEFVDSDDLLQGDSISKIVDIITHVYPDVILFSFKTFGNSEVVSQISGFEAMDEYAVSMAIKEMLGKGTIVSSVNKVYRRELLQDISFNEELSYAEDYLFNLDFFSRVRKIVGVNDILYLYRKEGVSLSNGYDVRNYEVANLIYKKSKELLSIHSIESVGEIEKNYAYNITSIIRRMIYNPGISYHEKIITLKQVCNDFYIEQMQYFYPGFFTRILGKHWFGFIYIYIRLIDKKKSK